jgi:F-type H+-transporting ATPase subunit b
MRSMLFRSAVLVALTMIAFPTLAHAASEGGAAPDPLSPNILNTVVTLVVFGALLAILYTSAWGPILKGLAAREEAQFRALDEAKKAREEAATMRVGVQAELAKAQEEIRAMMDEARRDAERLRATEREAGVKDAAAERERAMRDIQSAKDAALKELYTQAVDLAAMLSAKTIGREITPDDHRRLFDESLADLAQVNNPSA